MRQNSILMHFLHLGKIISIICIFVAFIGCDKAKKDDWIKADWLFINNSSHKIEVVSKSYNSFTILPKESYLYSEKGIGPSNVNASDLRPPYGIGDKIILNDNIEYTYSKDESITRNGNYNAVKKEYNYYEFTYIFTDDIINEILAK